MTEKKQRRAWPNYRCGPHRGPAVFVLGILVSVGVGCASSPDNGEALDTVEQDLYQYPAGFGEQCNWPNNTVNICFPPSFQSSNPTEVAWFKDALVHTWQAVARINFAYSSAATCPFDDRIEVRPRPVATWGLGARIYDGVNDHFKLDFDYCTAASCLAGGSDRVDYEERFRENVAHEIGHALQFDHEQSRPDYTTITCPSDNPADGQSATHDGGTYLTPDYDVDSVMNYCRGWDGTTTLGFRPGYHAADMLSPGDARGAQIRWGARVAYWMYPSLW